MDFQHENVNYSKLEVGAELTFPSVPDHDLEPALKAEAVDSVTCINQVKQYVVEQCLKCGNRRSDLRKKSTESIRAYDTERQSLPVYRSDISI